MNVRFRFAGIAVLLYVLQMTFVPLISVAGYTPDLLILWLVAMGIRRGRVETTVGGFLTGFAQDLATTQFLGLATLSKSITGFVAGAFFNENTAEQTLGSYRFVLSVLLMSAVHNLVYYSVFFQGVERSIAVAVIVSTAGTACYTAVVAVVPMFWFSKCYRTDWMR